MGLFGWLKELFFGGIPAKKPAPPLPGKAAAPLRVAPTKPAGVTPPTSYDPGEFAPISDKELRKASGTSEVKTSPWWGRTDTIPPCDDPRTKLIDRALVTRGYLTPERLAEIHSVGDQMLAYKGDPQLARTAADAAVARSKEDREALKAAKKREAEARRAKHAAEVAQRKATDILYLGRGVSGSLGERTSDAAKLRTLGLPLLSAPGDVAAAMGLPIPKLRWLAFHAEASTSSHYVRFKIPKKSGGEREIAAPMPELAAAQQWILANVLSKVPTTAFAHGFVPGKSTKTNAQPHVKRAVVVNMDLKDFFPTIVFPRVKGLFRSLGYSPAVSTVFALLATEAPRREVEYDGRRWHVALGPRALPQGACTSPALSNLAARSLDRRYAGLAAKLGWTYTRYADDLTFSGDTLIPKGQKDPRSVAWLLARTRHVAEDEGFTMNEKKIRVQRRNTAQVVTGIVVNEKTSVPRAERRRIRAMAHRAKTKGGVDLNVLHGWLAYIAMVDPERGAKMRPTV
ncbi:MAG TPA: reverse transcriptase family protein [Planctomycetota bacterium]